MKLKLSSITAASVSILSLALIAVAPLGAQDSTKVLAGPTLNETTVFLRGFLSDGVILTDEMVDRPVNRVRTVTFDGCKMEVQNTVERKLIAGNKDTYLWRVNLSDMDPMSVKNIGTNSQIGLDLQSTGGRRVVRVFSTDADAKTLAVRVHEEVYWSQNHIGFWVPDVDARERARRAFEHAIQLCGGKVSPF
jgi:hypothetical protein